MGRIFFADVCAHIPASVEGEKSMYPRIGAAFKDPVNGSVAIKIDTLPFAGSNWQGWINLFPRDKTPPKSQVWKDDPEDDIPF